MDSALHFRTYMRRLQAFALISEAEKNIVVVIVFYEREADKVISVTVRRKVILSAVIKDLFPDGFMDADFNFRLHGGQDIRKFQLGLLKIPGCKSFLL